MDTLDFNQLSQTINPDNKRLPYEANKQFFNKVAFDVFQLNTSPIESYWILETGDDGKQYLVAKYEDAATPELEAKSSWQALSDKEAKNVTVFYKGVPIHRCASLEFGFNPSDIHLFKRALVENLSKSPDFVKKLVDGLPDEKQKSLYQQFPELNVK